MAITAAYTYPEAEAWLTDVLAVIRENYEYLCRELRMALPQIRISPMDGNLFGLDRFWRLCKVGRYARPIRK